MQSEGVFERLIFISIIVEEIEVVSNYYKDLNYSKYVTFFFFGL